MKRKEFITLLGVGAGTVVVASCLGSCGKGGEPAPTPPPGTPVLTINNISINADIVNKGWTIQSGIIVAKSGANYLAVSGMCTHANNPMTYNSANNTFPCSEQAFPHGSVFDANGVKIEGPAQSNLKKYSTTLVDDVLKVFA